MHRARPGPTRYADTLRARQVQCHLGIDTEQTYLLGGLRRTRAPKAAGAVSSDKHQGQAAVIGFHRPRQQLARRRARRRHHRDRAACSLDAPQREERRRTLLKERPPLKARVPGELYHQRGAPGTRAQAHFAHARLGQHVGEMRRQVCILVIFCHSPSSFFTESRLR